MNYSYDDARFNNGSHVTIIFDLPRDSVEICMVESPDGSCWFTSIDPIRGSGIDLDYYGDGPWASSISVTPIDVKMMITVKLEDLQATLIELSVVFTPMQTFELFFNQENIMSFIKFLKEMYDDADHLKDHVDGFSDDFKNEPVSGGEFASILLTLFVLIIFLIIFSPIFFVLLF